MSGLRRSNVVVAAGTAVSRLTGLARIVTFGAVVGQTALADAFEAANNAPNAIYELAIGGVLSAALMPLFVRATTSRSTDRDVDAVATTTLVAAAVLTVAAVVAAPWIFRVFTLNPATGTDVAAFRSAGTTLTRIFLVQILFYAVIAVGSAALNARGRFFAAAWSPALANIVTIALVLLLPLTTDGGSPGIVDVASDRTTRWLLGLSTTLGIGASAAIMLAAVARSGAPFRPHFNLRHPRVRELVRMSGWTLGYVAANQAALVAVKNLASPGSGLVDAYAKAYALVQLPHGLAAVTIATTFAPLLARHAADRDDPAFADRLSAGLRYTVLLTLPASVALVSLARPVVDILLGYGNFDGVAVANTARALTGLAVGLTAFSVYLYALRGFYARGDTRTPCLINLGENAVNVALAVLLSERFDVLGLGLAFSGAYLSGAAVALAILSRRTVGWSVREFGISSLRWAAAAAAMGAMIVAVTGVSPHRVGTVRAALALATGSLAFIVVAAGLGDRDMRSAVRAAYRAARITRSSR
jgi:putative peptidoglycan lipid II flippase